MTDKPQHPIDTRPIFARGCTEDLIMPMSQATRTHLLLLLGPLGLLTLGLKLHKFAQLKLPYSPLVLYQAIRWDLLCFLLLGLALALYLERQDDLEQNRWLTAFYLCSFGGMLLLAIEHGFFLSTGSYASWYLIKYSVLYFGNIRAIVFDELKKPSALLLFVPPLLFLSSLFLANTPFFRRSANAHTRSDGLTPWPRAGWVVLALMLLLLPPRTGPSGQLNFLSHHVFAHILRGAVEDITSPQLFSPKAVAKAKALFRTEDLRFVSTPRTKRPNIVFLFLESTRASATTPYNPKLNTTPFLAKLAKRGVLVESMHPVIPHTSKALVSTLCGIYPRIGLVVSEGETGGIPGRCLPSLLRPHGYRTAFFNTSTLFFEGLAKMTQNMGFHTIRGSEDFSTKGFFETNYFGYEDRLMLRPSLAWVDRVRQTGQPFMLTYLTLTSHHQYNVPPKFPQKTYTKSTDPELNKHFNAVRYVDDFLRRVYEAFQRRGLLDNTLFVILGDHGEAFGEHFRRQHDNVLWQEGVHVPMVMLHPTLLQAGERIRGLRQQIDIAPSIADLLGYRIEGGHFAGHSLFRPASPTRTLYFSCWYAQQCMARRRGHRKHIYHYRQRPMELYALSKDPHEQQNLWGTKPAHQMQSQEIERDLRFWKARVNQIYDTASQRRLRQAVTQRMPAFQYKVSTQFGEFVRLEGYTLHDAQLQPGGSLELTYVFRVLRPIPSHYKLFVHLESRSRRDFLNQDHVPVGGLHPLSAWKPGSYVQDRQLIHIPAHFPRKDTLLLYIGIWSKSAGRVQPQGGLPAYPTDKKRRLRLLQHSLHMRPTQRRKMEGQDALAKRKRQPRKATASRPSSLRLSQTRPRVMLLGPSSRRSTRTERPVSLPTSRPFR